MWLLGNSMLIQLDQMTELATGLPVTTGVAAQAQVYDEGGVLRATVSLIHQSEGTWQGIASVDDVDPHIKVGDQIKVVYLVDGGGPSSETTIVKRPEVQERAA